MKVIGYLTDEQGRKQFALVAMPGSVDPVLSSDLVLELANPIRTARKAANITQANLARALNISQPMLSRQEQPSRRVRPSTIKRALEAIARIQGNRSKPTVALDKILSGYGVRLAESATRKPRDPVERRLLKEAGDTIALREREDQVRAVGVRRKPNWAKP